MPVAEGAAKRWCFTINNPTDDDMFWEDAEHEEQMDFIAVQYEVGEMGNSTLPGLSHSQAQEQTQLAQEQLQQQSTLGRRQEDQTLKHINIA